MNARRDDCIIITSLAPQDPQVVHARPLDVFFADGLRGPALMAREAPRRLGGALGEALVVVRLAKQAVAVPVGAPVHRLRCSPAVWLPWPAIIRCPIILAPAHLSHYKLRRPLDRAGQRPFLSW